MAEIPAPVLFLRDDFKRRLGRSVCGAWREVGPPELGVMAYDVCGEVPYHDAPHRAGWTGTGDAWWNAPWPMASAAGGSMSSSGESRSGSREGR